MLTSACFDAAVVEGGLYKHPTRRDGAVRVETQTDSGKPQCTASFAGNTWMSFLEYSAHPSP